MTYKVIGVMSGSSLDGLDIAYSHYNYIKGEWSFDTQHTITFPITKPLKNRLTNSTSLNAKDYLKLDIDFGKFIGENILRFIHERNLGFQIDFVVTHGHTTFHSPKDNITHQLGDINAIGSKLNLPVISHLRSLDVLRGGQGAPIVPVGEKFLFKGFSCFLNLGGIANISFHHLDKIIAYDICSANAVLNFLSRKMGVEYDDKGKIAQQGNSNKKILEQLNSLKYYHQPYPKSLSNQWAINNVFPFFENSKDSVHDMLRTYTEHIVEQTFKQILTQEKYDTLSKKMMITGGGALNHFLTELLIEKMKKINYEIIIPEKTIVEYKEAIIMGFLGILRWRLEANTLSVITGAKEDSINGILLQPS